MFIAAVFLTAKSWEPQRCPSIGEWLGLPWWLSCKEFACQMQETWVGSLCQEDPLEKGMGIHSSILPGELHGQRSQAGYSPWGHNELDAT